MGMGESKTQNEISEGLAGRAGSKNLGTGLRNLEPSKPQVRPGKSVLRFQVPSFSIIVSRARKKV